MTDRSANLGDCSQPCRWKYKEARIKKPYLPAGREEERSMKVIEEQERFEVDLEEDRHGTYFFNSHDLNLIGYIDELIKAGVTSLKIEGRAKSAYYVAIVTRAYRKVIDAIKKKVPKNKIKKLIEEQKKELDELTNRGYTAGFLLGDEPEHNFTGKSYGNKFQFVGEVVGMNKNLNIIRAHNGISMKDKIEAIAPEKNIPIEIRKIYNDKLLKVGEAHGGHDRKYYFELDKILPKRSLIRKKI
jgi:U32 family peptidase